MGKNTPSIWEYPRAGFYEYFLSKNDLYFTLIFIISLIIHFKLSLIGWNNTILDQHGFRQSQTAITAYYAIKDGFQIDYITPVLGKPWSIPMEFPLYQWVVALFVLITKYNLDQSGRLVSLTFFYLSLIPTYLLLGDYLRNKSHRLVVLTLILANPIYIFWPRTFMIESLALFLAISYLWISKNALEKNNFAYILVASMLGILAALTKVTTFIIFCFPLCFIFFKSWLKEYHLTNHTRAIKKYILDGLMIFFIPLIGTFIWTYFADYQKSQNPMAADFIYSTSLFHWNFGTLNQRLSIDTWLRILTINHSFLSFGILASLLMLALMLNRKYWKEIVLSLIFFSFGPIIFTNLYYVHNYYSFANSIFFSVSLGFGIISLLECTNKGIRFFASFVIVPLILASLYIEYHNGGYYASQKNNNLKLKSISEAVKMSTTEDEVVLIYGNEWNSSLPYYSQRKALMDIWELPLADTKLQKALREMEDSKISAMVVSGPRVHDEAFIKERVDYFNLNPAPVYWDVYGSLYVSNRNIARINPKPLEILLPQETTDIELAIDRLVVNNKFIEVVGWAYVKGLSSENSKIYLALESDKKSYVFHTSPQKRPDVTAHFKSLNYDDSGFSALVLRDDLEPGKHRVGVYITKNDDVKALKFTDKVIVLD